MQEYYKKLYDEEGTSGLLDNKNIFNTNDIPQITDSERDRLEQPLTEKELHTALKNLKNNKCPGSDGLSVEFYQTFWDEINGYLHKSLFFAQEQGVLSTEQKRGIISLILKKDTDRLSLHHWRPITLLSVDYKILTKALALRLKRIIPDLIFTDQTGYIAGRYIGTNLRTIEDIISYTDTTGESGFLLALNFQKAFDSVSWSSIAEALKLYGFGDMYIRWAQTVYQDSETCVSNNGFTSMWFSPKRGTRQGCPLSFLYWCLNY